MIPRVKCADYRAERRLEALRRRLARKDLSSRERAELEREAARLERELGLD